MALGVAAAVGFGAGWVLGVGHTPGEGYYDLAYNPLTGALIGATVPLVIWVIDRTGRRG